MQKENDKHTLITLSSIVSLHQYNNYSANTPSYHKLYSHTSESKIGVGMEDGKTERHKIAAHRRKGRVNAYINFSIRASNFSKAMVAVRSKTGMPYDRHEEHNIHLQRYLDESEHEY